MNGTICTQFDDLRREASRSAAAAALWLRHLETCAACLAQERVDAPLRASLRGIRPPAAGRAFTRGVLARMAAEPALSRGSGWARLVLLVYGGVAVAASASILAHLPTPPLDPAALRTIALGGALLSPVILLGGLRRTLARLLGS